jgi:hypothetical protein
MKITLKMTDLDLDTCAICLNELEDDNNIYTIPECNHNFHQLCIIEWYRRLGSDCGCPLCRSSPEGQTYFSRRGTINVYKQMSRRKNCPEVVKKLCTKHTECVKKQAECRKEANEYKRQHKEIFNEYQRLRRKSWQTNSRKWKLESQLLGLPSLLILRCLV